MGSVLAAWFYLALFLFGLCVIFVAIGIILAEGLSLIFKRLARVARQKVEK